MNAGVRVVFIVGAPGAGATLLLSLLKQHPQCRAVTPESIGVIPQSATKEAGVFLREPSSRMLIDRFSHLPADRVFVEEETGHLLQVGCIKRVFPEARIVLVRRDSQDVIWSMMQEDFFWKESTKTISQAVGLYNQFSKAQEVYSGYDAIIDYERLWDHPVEELEKLLCMLGLDPAPASDMVASTRKGRSLPLELSGAFRKGFPGEGRAHLSDADQAYLNSHLHVPGVNPRQLSILLATNHLLGWTGSETLLLTLIESLLAHSCKLTVYARCWDSEWLDNNFDNRILVVNDLELIKQQHFDLAHVQHNSCLVGVRAVFPALPVVFSSLGVLPFLEQPTPFDVGVSRYVAISEEVSNNLVASGVLPQKITVVRNMVSSDWFYPMSIIKKSPERILVLSYKMDEEKKSLLRQVAKRVGASIRFVGGVNGGISHKQLCEVINNSDVVVTIGRGVIETMLCGRVPLVFDIHGGDGLVTPDTLQDLWQCNFSGRRYRRNYTVDDLVVELSKYQYELGGRLRELALIYFDARHNVSRLMSLYEELVLEAAPVNLPDHTHKMLHFFSTLMREDFQYASQRIASESRLREEISRVKNSVSWRITAPFRVAWNVFLKLLNVRQG